jgi:hypothetical protein
VEELGARAEQPARVRSREPSYADDFGRARDVFPATVRLGRSYQARAP